MIILRNFFFCTLLLLAACNKRSFSKDPLTSYIPREDARYDIKFLRDLLEEAHPSLDEYLTEKQVNRIFDSMSATIPEKISLRDFYNKLSYITNEIGCSHTLTELPPVIEDTLYNRKLFFPFPTILLNNRLYINADNELTHGTTILSINGVSAAAILDSLVQYNPVDGYHRSIQKNAAAADFGYQYYLRFGCPEKFEIKTQEEKGNPEIHFFEPITLTDLNDRFNQRYYFDADDVTYYFRINEEKKYALLRLTDFSMETDNSEMAFENFLKNSFELLYYRKDIRTLIIDIRENTGGWLYNCFLLYSYLCKSEFREYKDVFTKISDIPYQNYLATTAGLYDTAEIRSALKEEFKAKTARGHSVPDSLIRTWKPDKHRFNGQVYIITNHAVASAASYFALLAKTGTSAKIVGMETAGGVYCGNGFHALKYRLPLSDIRVRFPYARLQYSNDRSGSGLGVAPDYNKPDTYDSFDKNEDLQIKFILDSILLKNR